MIKKQEKKEGLSVSKGKWKKQELVIEPIKKEAPKEKKMLIMMRCPRCSYEPVGERRQTGICARCEYSMHTTEQKIYKIPVVIG